MSSFYFLQAETFLAFYKQSSMECPLEQLEHLRLRGGKEI